MNVDSETKPIQLFENLLSLPKETFTKFHSEFVCVDFTYRTKIDNNIEIAFAVLQGEIQLEQQQLIERFTQKCS